MEEKKIRKRAAEELPQTVFLLEIETGKVLKQMRKEEWTEREDVVDKICLLYTSRVAADDPAGRQKQDHAFL